MIGHNCGICVTHTLHDAHAFIRSLQHRGRDATGIAAIGDRSVDVIKWLGPVDMVDLVDLHKIFPSSHYHTYMAHVRYTTKGSKAVPLEDAHPHVIGGQIRHEGNHVIITDCEMAAIHNGQIDAMCLEGVDRSALRTHCDTEAFLHYFSRHGEDAVLRRIPGAYTIAIARRGSGEVIVLRDRTGIRPGVLGWKDGKHVVASEDIALRKNGGELIEELDPGSVYYLESGGGYRKRKVVAARPAHCFFEWNYIADRDTILEGIYVKRLRRALGEALAEEHVLDGVQIVSYLPRAPEDAARSYARRTGKEFAPIFYKLRGERAFQGPTKSERAQSISSNLYLMPHARSKILRKSVLVIDDSVVRGNNIKREKELLEEADVGEFFHANYTPPIGVIGSDGVPRGCLFGVDMPPDDDFVARGRSITGIGEQAGVHMTFISIEKMLSVFETLGMPRQSLCTYCIGGEHPLCRLPGSDYPFSESLVDLPIA